MVSDDRDDAFIAKLLWWHTFVDKLSIYTRMEQPVVLLVLKDPIYAMAMPTLQEHH